MQRGLHTEPGVDAGAGRQPVAPAQRERAQALAHRVLRGGGEGIDVAVCQVGPTKIEIKTGPCCGEQLLRIVARREPPMRFVDDRQRLAPLAAATLHVGNVPGGSSPFGADQVGGAQGVERPARRELGGSHVAEVQLAVGLAGKQDRQHLR